MKEIGKAAFLAAAVLAFLWSTATDALSEISWVKGYDEGLRAAQNEGKPAMIDFTASWCGWCVKLDKDTFTDPTVQDLARSFVCVKVDLDREQAKAKQWSIRGIPHILFLSPDGALLTRVSGYKGPADFAQAMRNALKKYKPAPPKEEAGGAKPVPPRALEPAGGDAGPIFVECAKCKNIFNATSAKGTCPRCGAPYEVK